MAALGGSGTLVVLRCKIQAFIASPGKDRKVRGVGRNWKRQRDDVVMCA